ncbi:MAG: hypothetical protein WBA20_06780 [Ketobacter sp.]
MGMLLVTVFATIASALVCYKIAKAKNRNPQFWVVMAGLVGPFAIPFAYFSKPLKMDC